MSTPENSVIEAVFEIPSQPNIEASFELPEDTGISAIFEINTYITEETAEEFLERYIYPLQDDLAEEIERSTLADEELSAEIEEVKEDINSITESIEELDIRVEDVEEEVAKKVETIIGGPLLEVEREGDTVTITSKTFEFEQGIASDTWVIDHNLNKKPAVDVVDSSGSVQVPNEVVYNTPNTVTISFLAAFKGKAFLN